MISTIGSLAGWVGGCLWAALDLPDSSPAGRRAVTGRPVRARDGAVRARDGAVRARDGSVAAW
ncbi:hypothetical protein ACWGK6_32620, partial [Streptomyces violaceusniger]